MNTARSRPVASARPTRVGRFVRQFKGAAVVLVALLLAGVVWQLETRPFVPAAPYAAPVLALMLTGAVPANLSFGSDDLANATVTTAGFRFTTRGDALEFRLVFQGVADAGAEAVYLLSGRTYPLTLTLLTDGEAYRTFTAYKGTVTLSEDGGNIAAFLNDKTGERVFLSARFRRPDAS